MGTISVLFQLYYEIRSQNKQNLTQICIVHILDVTSKMIQQNNYQNEIKSYCNNLA